MLVFAFHKDAESFVIVTQQVFCLFVSVRLNNSEQVHLSDHNTDRYYEQSIKYLHENCYFIHYLMKFYSKL